VNGGFGVYTGNRPKKIADTVYDLFSDPDRLERMSKLAKQKSRPEATKLIAKDIGDIVLRKNELPKLTSSLQSND
jgi:UDP-N-acetylglucosamine:LPS N-acetylglucosamine transferase